MSHTVQLLNDSVFSIITDITIAISNNSDYFLYDVYNHCKSCGGLINITELGTWTGQDGLQITLQTDKFSRRWDYHKMRIKVAGLVSMSKRIPGMLLIQASHEEICCLNILFNFIHFF